jgi:hypothetical protein
MNDSEFLSSVIFRMERAIRLHHKELMYVDDMKALLNDRESQKAQGRREAAEGYCNICKKLGIRMPGCICDERKAIIGTASDEAPKAKEHSEYFGGESALSVACEIFNKLHLENESIAYWIKIEIENWYKEKAKNERAQGRREAAEAYCKNICGFFEECLPIGSCKKRKTILGTASDKKTDKGEI